MSVKYTVELLAELLDWYGQLNNGTWEQRLQALVDAINEQGGSGAAEVIAWFEGDTTAID